MIDLKHLKFVAAAVLFFLCASHALQAQAQSQTGFAYNGIVRAVFSDQDLGTPTGTTYQNFVQGTGANYVAITIEWFVATPSSTTIAANSSDSATDAQIIAEIQQDHALGLKVVLKPMVDLINYTSWRGDLDPTSVSAWFTSYQAYMTHYAALAQQYNVDAFSVGTELKTLSVAANYSYWQTVIAAVRADYSGPLMYDANATGAGDEYTTVSFWPLLDILGVDGYFGLTNHDDPTIAQLEAAWTSNDSPYTGTGFNAVAALQNLHNQYNKPVVFTELGYSSSKGTNEEPYAELSNGYDPTEQENCYTAFFTVFAPQSSWMQGIFWWALNTPLPGAQDQGFSMYGKPAGTTVLPLWYKGTLAPSSTTLSALPNPVSIGQTVTFTASTNGTVGTAAGNVSLEFSGTPLLTELLTSGATAFSVPTSGLQPGIYALTANFGGSSTYAVSASGPYSVTVNAAPTATTFTYGPSGVTVGQPITFNASVARTAASSTGAPSGLVNFYDGTLLLGSAPLSVGASSSLASLTFPTVGVSAGTYALTAQYAGDSTDATSAGAASVVLAPYSTLTSFSVTPSTVPANANTTLQAAVSRVGATGVPTGTVTFYDDSSPLLTVPVDGTGTATVPVSVAGIASGFYPLSAIYNGDSADASSTSTSVLVIVQ